MAASPAAAAAGSRSRVALTQGLSGANTYTGATMIQAGGTLILSNSGSVASSEGVTLSGGGATCLTSRAAAIGQTIKDLGGVAGSTVQLGANALTLGTATSTTFAGTVDDGGNGGSIVKQGSGTLTLSGIDSQYRRHDDQRRYAVGVVG